MFGSTFEMHFMNYESQKGKKKSQKWDIRRNKKNKKKNLLFCKVLNANENIKTLMFLGKRQRKLPRITLVNVL